MKSNSIRVFAFLLSLAAAQLACGQAGNAEKASGPLRVHPRNPRYFADGAGRAVYVAGSHTWDTLQDQGESDPPPAFDFDEYLDFLKQHHHNFIRLWRWELVSWDTRANELPNPRRHVVALHPWLRTGPENALDGKLKFELEKFNDAFFDRLRARVAAAGKRGMYVSVMLFEGWGLWHIPKGWEAHPFHPANNINKLGLKPDMKGLELFTLASPKALALQEAYVRKVIDTVNDLDNVLFEIANEADHLTTEWQYHMIRFVKQYEATKPKQHLVGMTSRGGAGGRKMDDLQRLLDSPADWISPCHYLRDYCANPPAADGTKVILCDTDHLGGLWGNVAWVWKTFLRGLHPLFMDPYKHRVLDGRPDEKWEPVRRAMGNTLLCAAKLDLAVMTPHDELASSRYCLANPGHDYLVYLPEGGPVTVDLSAAAGELNVEWMHPVTGAITPDKPIKGGAKRTLQPPFAGDAVLCIGK